MRLRSLKIKDAKYMLEWMHDESITHNLHANFASKTIDDCIMFIQNSKADKNNVHLAVVDDNDEYMGTVSLKHIDPKSRGAEFGIVVRCKALRKGFSWFAMSNIIKKAFCKYKLSFVYWCVSEDNARACRFYNKHHFSEMKDVPSYALDRYKDVPRLRWYIVRKKDKLNFLEKDAVLNCKIVKIKSIGTENAGQLSFFESNKDIPFDIKRIYYITNVPDGTRRGFHAHKALKQLLFCPYGEIMLLLDNGKEREEIILNDPSMGIVIDTPIWREMVWLKSNSILCVAASEYYSEDDYLRNYDDFIAYISKEGK